MTPRPALALAILATSLTAGAALRLWIAVVDDGVSWPDEIYQSIEPAHRIVYGYGLVAWEFVRGARNWTLPGLVAGILKTCDAVGLDRPGEYLVVIKAFFALAGVATAWSVGRLARSLGASATSAAAGAAAFALAAPAVYFAPRALGEAAAALPATLGLALCLAPAPRRASLVAGASFLGLAVLLRLHVGLLAAGMLVALAARRRWADLAVASAALATWALAYGAIDHLAWADAPGARLGGWFHSAAAYLRFNLVEHGADAWGRAPARFYVAHLYRSMPALSLGIAALCLLAGRRAPSAAAIVLAWLLAHTAIPHKELRFLLPGLPAACALAAVGLDAVRWSVWRAGATAALLAAAVISAAGFHRLTFADLGIESEHPERVAYDVPGAVNRLLRVAGERPDLCGLRVEAADLSWTAGYGAFHRRAPLYRGDRERAELGHFNYAIRVVADDAREQVAARDSLDPGVALVRVREGGCVPDPEFDWRL